MHIEVSIASWELECCGEPFAPGDRVTWKISADDPARTPQGSAPRFVVDHHDSLPDDVPQVEATGTVVAIRGLRYDYRRIPGSTVGWTSDFTDPYEFPVESSPRSRTDANRAHAYLVTLDVTDGVALPAYVEGETRARSRRESAAKAAAERELMSDATGTALEAIADLAESLYGDTVTVLRSEERSAATIEPLREGSAGVLWSRSSEAIFVRVDHAEWTLDATPESAAAVGRLLAAVAEGRVEVVVEETHESTILATTTVMASSDERWTSEESLGSATGGPRFVGKSTIDRIQRGSVQFAPWSDSTEPQHYPSTRSPAAASLRDRDRRG